MKIVKTIFAGFGSKKIPMLLTALILTGVGSSFAQGFYDDDLYYDASKSKKESTDKQSKKKQQRSTATQTPASDLSDTNHLYYYDGAAYVPWDNVGNYNAAGSYQPEGGSARDVDEYNRRGAVVAGTPDSVTLGQFENYSAEMAATRDLARFGGSTVAQQALEDEGYDLSFNNGYNEGYAAGYNNGLYNGDNTSVVVSLGTGYYPSWLYPYGLGGLYNTWDWPYNGWRYTYYNPYYYGWTPMWGWNWGWTSPSWAWGGCYPGGWHNHGWGGGWGGTYRPSSPSAAHRPRSGNNYDTSRGNHNTGGYRYGSGSSRPGYNPPVDGRVNGSSSTSGNRGSYNYGGSTSGRNSHYRGSSSGSSSGSTRSSGYSSGSSSSSRSGGYSSGSSSSGRSSGSFGGGSRGGSSSGGSRSGGGGGGHRSR